MKNSTIFTVSILLILLSFTSVFAKNNKITPENKVIIEANLLQGVNSDNEGLRINSAYLLGEIESSKAVIPLMRILREDNSESARLVAALSLVKIGDARGLYLVKKSAQFNTNDRVKKMCSKFYNAHQKGYNSDLIASNNSVIEFTGK